MKAINFPQASVNIAENQPQFSTLPSAVVLEPVKTENGQVGKAKTVVNCFSLSDEDIREIVKYRKLWYRQLIFEEALQPYNIFAMDDYFDEKSWSEAAKPMAKPIEYDRIFNVRIKVSFWDKIRMLFVDNYHIKVKGVLTTDQVIFPEPHLELRQDEKNN